MAVTLGTTTRPPGLGEALVWPTVKESAQDQRVPPTAHDAQGEGGSSLPLLLALFLGCYIAAATFFQTRSSSLSPWVDGAPIEYFTGSLLWLLSVICLVTASRYPLLRLRFLGWMLASAGLGALALDEIFALHEISGDLGGDDDYFKVGSWAAAAVALLMACRSERPSRLHMGAIALGYLFHSMYILVELGDGDLFQITFASKTVLLWAEEYLELFFLSCYFFGFAGFLSPRRNTHADRMLHGSSDVLQRHGLRAF